MRFTTVLELHGTSATGIEVPAAVVESFGAGRRVPVRVTLNGFAYRSTIAVMGGRYLVPVSAEHRVSAGVAAGQQVEVDLVHDPSPVEVVVPDDLAAALEAGGLRATFDALSASRRKEHARSVTGAKTESTRLKRVAKVVDVLHLSGR